MLRAKLTVRVVRVHRAEPEWFRVLAWNTRLLCRSVFWSILKLTNTLLQAKHTLIRHVSTVLRHADERPPVRA